ncbi:MAG: phosphoglycerate dehydrogenase [Gammaproteobacteria bacterium]|nr:phosphoglycerate dehydrogenase [Gammaproteobacteria bacterium]NNC98068.1 phosphoglycerate dehydrogenase [Gammaproteobacteria bacterium]NNM14618.1 phosphoglycerate dehydrogenase [Gammaproteobacteria bacterium]
MTAFKVLTLNNIAPEGLDHFPRETYEVASEIGHPDAIMLRSFKMHDFDMPDTVKIVGRAGAGVNNIPIEKYGQMGIPVLNAPGANANAVKELVLAGMFLAARNIPAAWQYVKDLELQGGDLKKAVEAGKKQYVGYEIPGKTLGVVGLGAIGVEVANAALALGMRVIGFDPSITVRNAWNMSAGVEQAVSLDDLCTRADLVSVHVPLVEGTKNLINENRIKLLKNDAVVLNFARDGIVDEDALLARLDEETLRYYVTDFPINDMKNHPRVIALPHLGASTAEAELNCAVMVAENIREYLENGNIRHSVNFPEAIMPRAPGAARITVANANIPNMVGQITTILADHDINIIDLLNKSRGDVAYTVIDIEGGSNGDLVKEIAGIKGVLMVRSLDAAA